MVQPCPGCFDYVAMLRIWRKSRSHRSPEAAQIAKCCPCCVEPPSWRANPVRSRWPIVLVVGAYRLSASTYPPASLGPCVSCPSRGGVFRRCFDSSPNRDSRCERLPAWGEGFRIQNAGVRERPGGEAAVAFLRPPIPVSSPLSGKQAARRAEALRAVEWFNS